MRIHFRSYPCFLIIITILCFWIGCGRKAPPVPPKRNLPPAVNDLSYHLDGNTLNLTWNIPLEEQKTTVTPAGCIVYRSKIDLSGHDCQRCPEQFKPIADILVEMDPSGKTTQKKMTFRKRLDKRYRYSYKVALYTPSGVFSNDSNTVVFIYE